MVVGKQRPKRAAPGSMQRGQAEEDVDDLANDSPERGCSDSRSREVKPRNGGRVAPTISSPHGRRAAELLESLCFLPEVFVFDLDDTLWKGDVDCTEGPPFRLNGQRELVARHGTGVTLFEDVPEIFEWLHGTGQRAAIASHTSTPDWADMALTLFKTATGVTYSKIAGVKEMHGASKTVHLTRIAKRAGCERQSMVFFDNMQYNIDDGEAVDVLSSFTPRGLTWDKFLECLIEFDRRAVADRGPPPPVRSAVRPSR